MVNPNLWESHWGKLADVGDDGSELPHTDQHILCEERYNLQCCCTTIKLTGNWGVAGVLPRQVLGVSTRDSPDYRHVARPVYTPNAWSGLCLAGPRPAAC